LCLGCHKRISRWDAKPANWLAAVPLLAGLAVLVVAPGWVRLVGLVLFVYGCGQSSSLPLVTLAGILFGWARNLAVVAVVVLAVMWLR
jgi:hypothetical protein